MRSHSNYSLTGLPNTQTCSFCERRGRKDRFLSSQAPLEMKMENQRWQRIESIYHAALEREPGAREAFLAQACAGDEELRREVEELLRYDGAAKSFLKGNALADEAQRL